MEPHRPADLLDLRVAIAGRRFIQFSYHGEEVVAEPHALLNGKRTHAFVLAGWRDGWQFYRYAEMKDLILTDRVFERRADVPQMVPRRQTHP